jgi:CDP-diglyceride synthetase
MRPAPAILASLDWVGAIGGALGALLLALNLSWSGWAYPVLLVFTGLMLIVAALRRRWPYAVLFSAFTLINLVGIYRWLLV